MRSMLIRSGKSSLEMVVYLHDTKLEIGCTKIASETVESGKGKAF